MFRAGCWPGIIGTLAVLLFAASMGGDPSAGLDMMLGLFMAPFLGIGFFLTGLAGGAMGLKISESK